MIVRSPRIPEWYIPDVPAWILSSSLTPEEQSTLLFLWACACEAIRKGGDPVWARNELVALMQQRLGLTGAQAYRRLQSLSKKTLGGKRLLKVGSAQEWVSTQGGGEETGLAQEWVFVSDRGSNPRGELVGLGEAFEADLSRIRKRIRTDANEIRTDANEIRIDAKFASMRMRFASMRMRFASMQSQTIKEVPYRGEGEIHDMHDHDITPSPQSEIHNIRTDANEIRIDANEIRTDANEIRIDANEIRTDANEIRIDANEIRRILEEAGIFPAKAAELAALLAEQGLTPEEVRRWIGAQLPELRRAAERTGGDPHSLLVWRLEQGIGRPSQEGPQPPLLPPLRPLTEAERAAWERAVEMALKNLHPLNRLVFERLEPQGIQDGGSPRALGIRVPAGNLAAIQLAQSPALRHALYEAFGEIIHPIPIEMGTQEHEGREMR